MTDLKPCPFCGGEAKAMTSRFSSGYFVECTVCGAHSRGFKGMLSYENGEVAESWNRRVEGQDGVCNMNVLVTKEKMNELSGEAPNWWITHYRCPKCGVMLAQQRERTADNGDIKFQDSLRTYKYCSECGQKLEGWHSRNGKYNNELP